MPVKDNTGDQDHVDLRGVDRLRARRVRFPDAEGARAPGQGIAGCRDHGVHVTGLPAGRVADGLPLLREGPDQHAGIRLVP